MTTEESPQEAPQDIPFNPWRRAKSAAARDLVGAILGLLEAQEQQRSLRKRARKAADQKTLEAQIEAVVCGLAHAHLKTPERWLAITRSKQILGSPDRYRAPVLSKTLPYVLDMLAGEVLEQHVGYQNPFNDNHHKQTVIRAGSFLQQRIEHLKLTCEDFILREESEPIVLKERKGDQWHKAKQIAYQDSLTTGIYRAQMDRINDGLRDAVVACDEGLVGHLINEDDRYLRRIFNNGSFEQGGRLYGGFWQRLSADQRRRAITINDEEVVTLDFGQAGPRILYGMAGHALPFADAYALPSLAYQFRAGVKKVLNAMLNSSKPLSRFPAETRELFQRKSFKIGDVTTAIIRDHASVASYFYSGAGLEIMFKESQVLVEILLRLIDLNIVALPIHDAVVVRRSDAAATKEVMEAVFSELVGIEALVGEE